MVCHDGSESSIDCLNVIKDGLFKKGDKLLVANIWSTDKEKYLKFNLKNNYIEETTSSSCTGLGDAFGFYSRRMKEG